MWLTPSSRADGRGVEQLQAGPKLSGSGVPDQGEQDEVLVGLGRPC